MQLKKIFLLLLCIFSISLLAYRTKALKKGVEIAFNQHPNFGKTHFIVGYEADTKKAASVQINTHNLCDELGLVCNGVVKQVFFAPDDRIHQALLYLIGQEKKFIRLAIYTFTDKDIAQALIDAQKRGVEIQVVVDPGYKQDKFTKVIDLIKNGIQTFVYNPDYNKNDRYKLSNSLMHHKFILFGQNIMDKPLIWTGSFNLTKSAHMRNQENAFVCDDIHIHEKYAKQFDILKKRSKKRKIIKRKTEEKAVNESLEKASADVQTAHA